MANFTAQLEFIDLTHEPAPRMTDLLFFNFEARHDYQTQYYGRGWVEEDGRLMLIGGQWVPTHYALVPDFYAAAELAEAAAVGSGEDKEGSK